VTGLEWIIALGICWWVLRGVGADLRVVMRGRTPERVAAGRARGGYGLRSYLRDVWSDAWTVARAKRQARVEQRLAHIREHGPGPTWRQRANERWSAAWGRWEQRMAERQARREQATARPDPEPVAPAAPTGPDPGVPRQRVDQDPEQEQTNPEQEQRREPVEPVTVTPWHPDRDRPEPQELTARPTDDGRWVVDPDPHRAGETRERRDDDMAEVTGLASALAHAQQMRQAYEESTVSAEQYLAGLEAGGVTGEALAAVQQAMEAQQAAAAAWGQAEATLSRHMQVKEAYDANRDAGTREFVTAE